MQKPIKGLSNLDIVLAKNSAVNAQNAVMLNAHQENLKNPKLCATWILVGNVLEGLFAPKSNRQLSQQRLVKGDV